ncbi:RdgB/HAM1 family non-canonical purine NTP pyrophosphatase [Sphingosinicella rhizophila]|uniref:dITP/XTP pyrophosphatase n=1 Tax=Sphingosinicella rhizophila TaxID=3050082 RepID=A0ABU3QA14_9SPHN|nr:RdgB/HAM1 family non-canonical purine NTP pyrophosphatase [Sphingosinicella sp. GR2756]MDT9599785.1 RdgB/HAM1 family non-canonical purine NTP pyrophosphatase [Sphingosinicella sp. GR2756]
MRKLGAGKLVIASHNPGKVREIAELLGPYGIEAVSAADLDLPEPDEIGVTFVDNADLKARSAADLSGLPALADDSGLCVDALEGRPGIYSARWAGENKDFRIAMERVHREMLAVDPEAGRNAHFVCALAVCWPQDGQCESFEGRVDGTLVWPPRGDNGFGYDPMFQPIGYDRTFAEMDPAEKYAIDHRADAFRKLVAALIE